jgi:acyl carrier protein
MDQNGFLQLLDELFEFESGTIQADQALQEIPGWNSLTFVGLIAMVDEECGVTLAPGAVLKCRTVGDVFALVTPTGSAHKRAA